MLDLLVCSLIDLHDKQLLKAQSKAIFHAIISDNFLTSCQNSSLALLFTKRRLTM